MVNWDFERLRVGGQPRVLPEGRYCHFLDTGNSGWTGTVDIEGWSYVGELKQGAGVYNSALNEIGGFAGEAGSHVLFINAGEVGQPVDLAPALSYSTLPTSFPTPLRPLLSAC